MYLRNIKNYVYYHADNYPSLAILKTSFFVFSYLCLITSVPCIVTKKYLYFVFMIILTIIYGIMVTVFQTKCKTPYFILRFVAKGTLGTFYSMVFLMMELSVLSALNKVTYTYILLLILGYIFILLLFFVITLLLVKNGNYEKSTGRRKIDISIYIPFFVVLGVILFGIISNRLSQNTIINIFIVLCSIVISFGALGTTEYLKCYYIMKYPIISKEQQHLGSEELMRKNTYTSKTKKRLFVFLAIIILFFIVTFIKSLID